LNDLARVHLGGADIVLVCNLHQGEHVRSADSQKERGTGMIRNPLWRGWPGAIAAVVLSLVLQACGGEEDPEGTLTGAVALAETTGASSKHTIQNLEVYKFMQGKACSWGGKSEQWDQRCPFYLKNNTGATVYLFWKDYEGKYRQGNRGIPIPPGQEHWGLTFRTHVYKVAKQRDGSKCFTKLRIASCQ
jgi:hypothetical protein